jgi:hypothetical protein
MQFRTQVIAEKHAQNPIIAAPHFRACPIYADMVYNALRRLSA